MQHTDRGSTLVGIRRLYLYGVAFVALWLLTFPLASLLDLGLLKLFEATLVGPLEYVPPEQLAERVRYSTVYTGLYLPLFAIHAGLAQWLVARNGEAERRSSIRRVYLAAVLVTQGLLLALSLLWVGGGLTEMAIRGGALRDAVNDYESLFTLALGTLLSAGVLWTAHAWIAHRDAQALAGAGWSLAIGRGGVVVIAVAGVVLVAAASVVGLSARFAQ